MREKDATKTASGQDLICKKGGSTEEVVHQGERKKERQGKDRDTQMGRRKGGGGVKFPSGFQLGRINSVLELTLTPRLPPLLTGQVTCTHSRGLQRDSDCITASLTAAEVAENGTIKKGASERKTETGARVLREAERPAERWLIIMKQADLLDISAFTCLHRFLNLGVLVHIHTSTPQTARAKRQ